MKSKILLLILLFFAFPVKAEKPDIEKEINEQLKILENQLGAIELSKKPLAVPLVTPERNESDYISRGPTEPLPAVTEGQDIVGLKNLATISGVVNFENIKNDENFSSLWNKRSHIEVFFFDSVSPSGVPNSSSIELTPPLILAAGENKFKLKAPVGSEGYLVAYIYHAEAGRSDIAIFSEEIIGVSTVKVKVLKGGLKDLDISIFKIKTLQEQNPFISLSGWVHNEYQQNIGLSQVAISIVGTTIASITDKFGRYSFPQLPKFSRIILQVERVGYVTTRVLIELGNRDNELDIFLSPKSKYSRSLTSSISRWDSSKYGLIEGKFLDAKNGLIVRVSGEAEGVIYLDNAGLPSDFITKEDWEKGKFEKGVMENGEFLIANVESGLVWVEVWDGARLVIKEPINVETGVVVKINIDLSKVHGFAGSAKYSDYIGASNLMINSLTTDGSVDIQPVGFIQRENESSEGIWVESSQVGEFIFPDFEFGAGRVILELKKDAFLTTISSAKIGTTPRLLIYPESFFIDQISTANRKIKKNNHSKSIKLQYFPEILKGTGLVLVDVPTIPPRTVVECIGNQGAIAYLGEKGLIDIYSSSTTPEGDGRFMLYNLLPGEYTIAGYNEDALVFLETVIVKNGQVTFISINH